MTNIKFENWQCHDAQPAMTQEDSLRKLLAFVGIHDVAANNLIESYDIGDSSGTWVHFGTTVTGNGGALEKWYQLFYDVDVPVGFAMDFYKDGDVGGVVFGGATGSFKSYLVWWTATRMGLAKLSSIGEYTGIVELPNIISGNSFVRVVVKPIQATVIEQVDDWAISLFFDDRIAFSHSVEYDSSYGNKVGFASYHDCATAYSDPVIQQFHQIVEVTYLGPTEQVSSALSRVLGMDKIRVQARYDGSVLIWRNDSLTSVMTYDSSLIQSEDETEDMYAPNHFRLTGGLYEADIVAGYDVLDPDQQRGHLFAVADDPNSVTEMVTYLRAKRKAIEAIEGAEVREPVVPFRPMLEAEDVVTLVGQHVAGAMYRVTNIDFRAAMDERGVRYESKLTCRRLHSVF